MIQMDEATLDGYLSTWLNNKYPHLLNPWFQAQVMTVKGSSPPFTVTLQRLGEPQPDGGEYVVAPTGYLPQPGDQVECIWRDSNTAYVMWPLNPAGAVRKGSRDLLRVDILPSAAQFSPWLTVPSSYDTVEWSVTAPAAGGGNAYYLQCNGQVTTTSAFGVFETTSQAGAITGGSSAQPAGARIGTLGTTGGGFAGRILGCQTSNYHAVLSDGFRLSTASTFQGEANQGILAVAAKVSSLRMAALNANTAALFPAGTKITWYGVQA